MTAELPSARGRVSALIPWLSIRTLHDVRWTAAGTDHALDLPLQPLGVDDRLIGYVGADPDALAPLFQGKNLVRVPLDITDPLPGDITAWEALDGIVIDSAAASRLSESTVRSLLTHGTAIAIRSTQKPGGNWPWQRQTPYWIYCADLAGPDSAYVPDAYSPLQSWPRGWPASFRRKILGAGTIFSIGIIAASLGRSRWSIVGVVSLAFLATVLALLWRSHQSVSIEATGSVIVLSDSTTQRDQWTYRAVLRDADESIPWQPHSRPVFGYRQQAEEIAARQICSSDGHPLTLHYHLKPRQSLAFQSRGLIAGKQPLASTMPISSPLRTFADDLYAMKGDSMVGQMRRDNEEDWPDVVIQRTQSIILSTNRHE